MLELLPNYREKWMLYNVEICVHDDACLAAVFCLYLYGRREADQMQNKGIKKGPTEVPVPK